MHISPGKYRGFQRLGNSNGVLKMVAIDQRNPILEPIRRKRGLPEAPYADVVEVKELLARFLSPKASAMLLDPIYSFPVALPLIGAEPGLILAYENSVLEQTPEGSKSSPIPGWSVDKARQAGADAVKVLVWHRADAPAAVREHQREFVRKAGEACRRADIVNLTEILVYPLPGEDPAYVRANRSRLVQEALADFLDPSFNIDIYKLEPPAALTGVPDPDGSEAAGVQAEFDRLAARLPRPWVLLSAGAGAEDFRRSLTYAYRAGASGYLCGRAIWQSAFDQFPDREAMQRVLKDDAVPYLDGLNELSDRMATPWHAHPSFAGSLSFAHQGRDFPQSYAA